MGYSIYKWLRYVQYTVYIYMYTLVAGLEPWNFMTFHMLGIILPAVTHSYFLRGVGIPPTRLLLTIINHIITIIYINHI